MPHTISARSIRKGQQILIRGRLGYARLRKPIEGEALERENVRRVARNLSPMTKPFHPATVTNAEVLYLDPANPTLEEQYIAERRYTSDQRPEAGLQYSIESKGSSPTIAVMDGTGGYVKDISEKELASGLDVTFVLEVYEARNQPNNGVALRTVIVNEPVRYYENATNTALAARGITIAPAAVVAAPAASAGASAVAAPVAVAEPDLGLPQMEIPIQPQAPVVVTPAPAPVVSPVAAPAPVAVQVPAAPMATAPAAVEETLEEKIARLEAFEAAHANAAAAAAAAPNPWGQAAPTPGITFDGQG